MADWQESAQAVVIALIFAFMVAKLVSVVVSFRAGNLRVERGFSRKEALLSDEGKELLGDESGSSSSDEGEHPPSVELIDKEGENVRASDLKEKNLDSLVAEGVDVRLSDVKEEDVRLSDVQEEDEIRSADVEEKIFDVAIKKDHVEEHSLLEGVDEGGKERKEERTDGKSFEGVVESSEFDDWEGVESSELEELFNAAATFVTTQAVGPGLTVSNETQLLLYGLYKSATEGPCNTPQPSAYKLSARAKWNAWQKLGSIGQEEAMNRYITLVSEISPEWLKGRPKGGDEAQETASAAQRGRIGGPVFSTLVQNVEGGEEEGSMEAVHVFAREGDLAGLTQQLENGVETDLKDSEGRTSLHWAADRGHLDIVELLLAKGAQIYSKDVEGQTALHYAVICEREEIARYLISKGADPSMPDNEGTTPLASCPSRWSWMRNVDDK